MSDALDLMTRFAARTGLTLDLPQRRYLWTDAFAVDNLVALGRTDLAIALVDRVHHVLGRHRADDTRDGWLSTSAGEDHPTRGGLRIGKEMQERGPRQPVDDRTEWDRDGQYFHYLTKWMRALARMADATGEARYGVWARELADVASRRFVHGTRMYWKMSIDLSRPQVASMGQHDPVDGYVTCLALERCAGGPDLGAAIAAFRAMIDRRALVTSDPLGLGGLLCDAAELARLDRDRELHDALLAAASLGVDRYLAGPDLRLAADQRLAFRELGLAIGLAAAGARAGLRDQILSFWLVPAHRQTRTWLEHEDIDDVMLATGLLRASAGSQQLQSCG